ncbi:MAG TPA: hypothetical protein VJ464_12955 [Blastocatellia bacterium]|nr:hypothetical protein [Blastocatellia bacterium]
MSQVTSALKEAIAAVERLSARQQRKLAAHLLEHASDEEGTFILCLKRLSRARQSRLADLMERNNEGTLGKKEREELRHLADEVDRLVLENSIALTRALRPEVPQRANATIKRGFRQKAMKSHT